MAGGQAVAALGSIVGVRVLTLLLDPAEYGEFALGLTIAVLLSQIVLGPLASTSERFYAQSIEAGRTGAYFAALRRLTAMASALILAGGLVLALALFIAGRAEWLPLVTSAVIFALLSGWEGVLDAIQNAARQRAVVAWHQSLRQWLRPCLAFILVATIAASGSVGLAAYALASALVLGSQSWFFQRGPHRIALGEASRTAVGALERRMLAYATPFSMWGLFTWVQISSDRWALQLLGSSEQVGLYAIVLQLGLYPINLVAALLVQFAAPIVFAHAGEGVEIARMTSAARLCWLLAAGMLGFSLLLAAVTIPLHRAIFSVAVGPQYQAVSYLLPVAVLAGGLFNVGQLLALVPMALGATRSLLAPKIGTALVALVLNALGAYLFGIAGVLVAGLLFAAFYLAWVTLIGRTLVARRASLSPVHL